jgi:hypothetical protein
MTGASDSSRRCGGNWQQIVRTYKDSYPLIPAVFRARCLGSAISYSIVCEPQSVTALLQKVAVESTGRDFLHLLISATRERSWMMAQERRKLNKNQFLRIALTALLLTVGLGAVSSQSAETSVAVPSPAMDEAPHGESETAVFAGGFFWGVQGVFQHMKGVSSAVSGYAGGNKATAHYQLVGSGTTGHAESVRITYDPGRSAMGGYCRCISRWPMTAPSSIARGPT